MQICPYSLWRLVQMWVALQQQQTKKQLLSVSWIWALDLDLIPKWKIQPIPNIYCWLVCCKLVSIHLKPNTWTKYVRNEKQHPISIVNWFVYLGKNEQMLTDNYFNLNQTLIRPWFKDSNLNKTLPIIGKIKWIPYGQNIH